MLHDTDPVVLNDKNRVAIATETQRAYQGNRRDAGDQRFARSLFAGNCGVRFPPAKEEQAALIEDEADAILAIARAVEVSR